MRLIPCVVALMVVALSLVATFYVNSSQQSIVFFDKEVVQGQFIRQLAELKASESQVEQSTKTFNATLNKVLVATAKQKKAVILNKKEVLAGGVDVTDEVLLNVGRAMRRHA